VYAYVTGSLAAAERNKRKSPVKSDTRFPIV